MSKLRLLVNRHLYVVIVLAFIVGTVLDHYLLGLMSLNEYIAQNLWELSLVFLGILLEKKKKNLEMLENTKR